MAPPPRSTGHPPAAPRWWWFLPLSLAVHWSEATNPNPSASPARSPDDPGPVAVIGGRFALDRATLGQIRESCEPLAIDDDQGRPTLLAAEVEGLLRAHPRLDSPRVRDCLRSLKRSAIRVAYLDSRVATVDASLAEVDAEATRAGALGEYVVFEDRSQRVEEQDIAYRLCKLLEGDQAQAARELNRLHRVDEDAGSGVEDERIERQEERYLAFALRAESLGPERESLSELAPAAQAAFEATRALITYHEQRRSWLEARREALSLERDAANARVEAEAHRLDAILAALVLGLDPETGAESDWSRACPGLQEDSARLLFSGPHADGPLGDRRAARGRSPGADPGTGGTIPHAAPLDSYRSAAEAALRLEARAAHRELGAIREALAADLAALDFEVEVLQAALLFDSYLIRRVEAHIARLDARAELTEARLRYARRRLERDRAIEAGGLGNALATERAARLVEHLDHASQRSWSDQATLRRLLAALESLSRADRKSMPALDRHRSAVEESIALAGIIQDNSCLDRWRPRGAERRPSRSPSLSPVSGLSGVEEGLRDARRALDRVVEGELELFASPRSRVDGGFSRALASVDPARAGRIEPLRTLPRHSYHDPNPISVRGPDDILRSAMQSKGDEMDHWQRLAGELDVD